MATFRCDVCQKEVRCSIQCKQLAFVVRQFITGWSEGGFIGASYQVEGE